MSECETINITLPIWVIRKLAEESAYYDCAVAETAAMIIENHYVEEELSDIDCDLIACRITPAEHKALSGSK